RSEKKRPKRVLRKVLLLRRVRRRARRRAVRKSGKSVIHTPPLARFCRYAILRLADKAAYLLQTVRTNNSLTEPSVLGCPNFSELAPEHWVFYLSVLVRVIAT